MKETCGIITFYNAHNYGAVLQTYALKKELLSLGFDVHIICYDNYAIRKVYLYNRIIKFEHNFIKFIKMILNKIYSEKEYKIRWKKFDYFIKQLVGNNSKVYTRLEDFININFDYIIFGSDQIWNPNITKGIDKVYMGDFSTRAKKITYAASMGINKLDKDNENKFFNLLKSFNYISVREVQLQKYIESNSSYNIEVVLDPTLLLKKQNYNNILINIFKNRKYLLVYTFKNNRELVKKSNILAKKIGLELIIVSCVKTLKYVGYYQRGDLGVGEFLGAIKNASFIVTDSFHGTAFSIIFNKQFYTLPSGEVSSRTISLLSELNLLNRYKQIKDINKIEPKINYKNVNKVLDSKRKNSVNFLRMALDLNS